MIKIFVLLGLLSWTNLHPVPATEITTASCPGITQVEKVYQNYNSRVYEWNKVYEGAQYRVWYVRQEDGYNSGYFYTYNNSYVFTSLSSGHYTFYFQTICGGESSSYIGIEDVIGA
ncbi:MAG TPA: hypothetical protein PLO67_04385 [Saprospiraceae bacterium]|nr:hypothetical protein [Saprospiraceae bacterium]HPI04866.1 hypothetical protein [Saprospiraceae bacterium]